MNISETIKSWPDGMTVAVLREDMVVVELVCTTTHLKRLLDVLEKCETAIEATEKLVGVKNELLIQIREALGIQ